MLPAGLFAAQIALIFGVSLVGVRALWALIAVGVLPLVVFNVRTTWRVARFSSAGSKVGQIAIVWLLPIAGALLVDDLLEGSPPDVFDEEVDYEILDGAEETTVSATATPVEAADVACSAND